MKRSNSASIENLAPPPEMPTRIPLADIHLNPGYEVVNGLDRYGKPRPNIPWKDVAGGKVIIFDLDDTLSDDTHRHHYFDEDKMDWDGYFGECVDDEPVDAMIELFNMEVADTCGSPGRWVHVWTTRTCTVQNESRDWLLKHTGCQLPFVLRMRSAKDYRYHVDVKNDWIEDVKDAGGLIMRAYDDSTKMIHRFRELGITALQHREETY